MKSVKGFAVQPITVLGVLAASVALGLAGCGGGGSSTGASTAITTVVERTIVEPPFVAGDQPCCGEIPPYKQRCLIRKVGTALTMTFKRWTTDFSTIREEWCAGQARAYSDAATGVYWRPDPGAAASAPVIVCAMKQGPDGRETAIATVRDTSATLDALKACAGFTQIGWLDVS